jgi:hypothetical protein
VLVSELFEGDGDPDVSWLIAGKTQMVAGYNG